VQSIYQLLILILTWLAVPVVLVYAYDKWVLEPKRPRTPEGEPAPGPLYTRIAGNLLPFVLIAAVISIGVKEVFDWAGQVAVPLSLVSLPLVLWLGIDSWFFAPRRQIAARSTEVPDPPLLRAAYFVLPVFVIAPIVRMIRAETLDFSLVLLILSLATGLVWGLDHWVFRPKREAAAAAVKPPVTLGEPGTVDYARSFFPVAAIVLIVRAFIFEPFRIPSDSMMPTLLDGDFIVVNKYAYGLRMPVLNRKFLDTGSPQRGDVVVFRYPPNPNINYIKRLVGLPGDRIEVRDDHLIINGETVAQVDQGRYTDGCYVGLQLSTETVGAHTHQVMSCHSPHGLLGGRSFAFSGNPDPLPACDRKKIAEEIGGWVCDASGGEGSRDAHDYVFDVVPAGHYVMIGDNRDNSEDSRAWGLVPDQNLVGKATRIWFNFDLQRSRVVNWSRIGQGIE
jgi:signal peptidase I